MADSELGRGYIVIEPKMDEGKFDSSGSSSGKSFGGAFSVAAGNLIANAVTNIAGAAVDVFKQAFDNYANFEQLSGGVEKIFDEADIDQIMADANNAYKELNMSANEYLESINQTGAAFASTMGDQKGYETARKGMKAISDYASGTGRNLEELNQKYALITRSTQSYQSIADQFSGILPATSSGFLEAAQAAGFLSDEYTSLTEVPIDEYQAAVTAMLEQGVDDMGLASNTLEESTKTVSGSLAMLESSWQNLLTGLFSDDADIATLAGNLWESLGAVASNIMPRLGSLVMNLFTKIPDAIGNALSTLPDTLSPMIDSVFGEGVGGQVFTIISDTVTNIQNVIQGATEVIQGMIETAWPAIEQYITIAMQGIDAFMQLVWPNIQNLITTVMNTVSQVIQSVWPVIVNVWSIATNAIQAVAQAVWPVISSIVQIAMDAITTAIDAIGPMVGFVSGVFDSILNVIRDPMQAASDFVSGIIDEIIGFFSGLGDRITSAIGSIHFPQPHITWEDVKVGPANIPVPHIDWYARGGFVDGATLIGAGEAGPEMILPRQGGLMDEFASSVASKVSGISINGPVTVIADDPEDFIRQLTSFAARTRAQYA